MTQDEPTIDDEPLTELPELDKGDDVHVTVEKDGEILKLPLTVEFGRDSHRHSYRLSYEGRNYGDLWGANAPDENVTFARCTREGGDGHHDVYAIEVQD